jgi:pSer/pThr/pTyr-binding forkhead associated (FHA) protein
MPTIIEHPQIDEEMRAVLRWEESPGERQALFLKENEMAQIGRDRGNDIVLGSPQVSRHHAVVSWSDGRFIVKDLGSKNGTKVNRERISGIHELSDGDELQLGDAELVYQYLHELAPEMIDDFKTRNTFIVRQDVAQPKLIVSAGPHEGRVFILGAGKTVIGRATSSSVWDISLQDKSVSRPHAEILKEDAQFTLTDLKSANGVLVNGDLIAEKVELQDGDVIEIGETTLLFRSR